MRSSRCFNSRAHGGRDTTRTINGYTLDVSIHAPTGGATSRNEQAAREQKFQFTRPRGARLVQPRRPQDGTVSIHAPTGGATFSSSPPSQSRQFQFTRPRGARPVRTGRGDGALRFNSRAHGGRDFAQDGKRWIVQFQFTRPRGARQKFGENAYILLVSIHAPTGGATLDRDRFSDPRNVSIHAPTGGATCASVRRAEFVWRFNSRAHGGRDSFRRPARTASRVSIHAPTGGATGLRQRVGLRRRVSIHAPTGGATGLAPLLVLGAEVSIHAPTGGAT